MLRAVTGSRFPVGHRIEEHPLRPLQIHISNNRLRNAQFGDRFLDCPGHDLKIRRNDHNAKQRTFVAYLAVQLGDTLQGQVDRLRDVGVL